MVSITPSRDVRRLQFSGSRSDLETPYSSLAKSPYTPFSRDAFASPPKSSPNAPNSRSENAGVVSVSFQAPESAEKFINGGLDETLRGAAVDLLSAISEQNADTLSAEALQGFVAEVLATLEVQLEYASEIISDHAIHPYVRKEVQNLYDVLLIERDTWLLVEYAWKPPDHLITDLGTRRLQPNVFDMELFADIPGYVKCQRILAWLETTSHESLQRSGGPQLKPLDDPAYRWDYTATKQGGDALSMDSPLAADSVLDEVEQKAEVRLSREVFRMVRAGRLDEAEQICRHVGQPWRAAALAGGKNCSSIAANGIKGHARRTWRTAAAAIARSTNAAIPVHERAVCGVLSGVLEPILAVANSYEDQAWARLSVLMDSTADKLTKGTLPNMANIDDSTIVQTFRECEHATESTAPVEKDVMKGIRIMRSFIGIGPSIETGHRNELLETLAAISAKGAQLGAEWVCRLCALLGIFLKLSGLCNGIEENPSVASSFDLSVESYVRLIIEKDLDEEERAKAQGTILPARVIVFNVSASYLSELYSQDRIVATYAELLYATLKADLWHEQTEADRLGTSSHEVNERRTLCLEYAGQCFNRETLNAVVIAAVDLVWASHLPDRDIFEMASPGNIAKHSAFDDITADDELVVRAIEFLIYPGYANYQETIRRGTKAVRRFFLMNKRSAARRLVTWFPSGVLAQIQPGLCEEAIHEFDCWRAYMEAISRHAEWNAYFSSQRPSYLPESIRATALAQPGQVSYEAQASANIQLERYVKEMEEFDRVSTSLRQAAVESLKSALLFSGGWMQDFNYEHENAMSARAAREIDQKRKEEIKAVRRNGIPQLTALLHHVLHESGQYSDAMGLANLVADESLRLYDNFGEAELNAFLSRIADSAVLLSDETVRTKQCSRPYEGMFFEELPA